MKIFLLICGFMFIVFIVLAILDHFNVTHIFMKKRGSGGISGAFRAVQDAFEPSAKKAHEVIIEEIEKEATFEISSSEPGKEENTDQ